MFWFLILSPIPFALTRDSISPHGTRLILMTIPILYFIVTGIVSTVNRLRHFSLLKWLLIGLVGVVYAALFADFNHYYFIHYPQIAARTWHYGLKQAVMQAEQQTGQSAKTYYSNSAEPFLPFFLYYTRYLPSNGSCIPADMIQPENSNFFTGQHIDHKYYFGHIEWEKLFQSKTGYQEAIFVVTSNDMARIISAAEEHDLEIIPVFTMTKKYTEQETFNLLHFADLDSAK